MITIVEASWSKVDLFDLVLDDIFRVHCQLEWLWLSFGDRLFEPRDTFSILSWNNENISLTCDKEPFLILADIDTLDRLTHTWQKRLRTLLTHLFVKADVTVCRANSKSSRSCGCNGVEKYISFVDTTPHD